MFSTAQGSPSYRRAWSVTAAHLLTLDFTELTSPEELQRTGVLLRDRASHADIRVHSLFDLKLDRSYVTPRGASLRRISPGEALLNEQVSLPVTPPDADADGGRSSVSAVAHAALESVRMLRAEPGVESLAELERTLIRLPSSGSNDWLECFLQLDGLQALLDVLGHSQSRFAQLVEDEQLQV